MSNHRCRHDCRCADCNRRWCSKSGKCPQCERIAALEKQVAELRAELATIPRYSYTWGQVVNVPAVWPASPCPTCGRYGCTEMHVICGDGTIAHADTTVTWTPHS